LWGFLSPRLWQTDDDAKATSSRRREMLGNVGRAVVLPYLTGQETTSPRIEYFYFSDDGDLLALRYGNWKVQFKVQDEPGTMRIWQREFENLRLPYLFNLKTDPYERATITSNTYWDWYIRHVVLQTLQKAHGG
jgi:arylsulfatase